MFELTAVNYVENTDTAPFISHSAVVIALTYDCKLYADSNVIPENGLIDKLWFIDNRLKGKVINNILNEIKPLVSEILKNIAKCIILKKCVGNMYLLMNINIIHYVMI